MGLAVARVARGLAGKADDDLALDSASEEDNEARQDAETTEVGHAYWRDL